MASRTKTVVRVSGGAAFSVVEGEYVMRDLLRYTQDDRTPRRPAFQGELGSHALFGLSVLSILRFLCVDPLCGFSQSQLEQGNVGEPEGTG